MTDRTNKQIAALEAEIAALKPTPIDHAAAGAWRDNCTNSAKRERYDRRSRCFLALNSRQCKQPLPTISAKLSRCEIVAHRPVPQVKASSQHPNRSRMFVVEAAEDGSTLSPSETDLARVSDAEMKS
jgi:hypothetical protein